MIVAVWSMQEPPLHRPDGSSATVIALRQDPVARRVGHETRFPPAHKNSFTEHLSDVSQILIKYTQGVCATHDSDYG